MNDEDLRQELQQLPVKYLHRLARGRIHRHFRLGKHQLIECILAFPPDEKIAIATDLQRLALPIQDHVLNTTNTETRPLRGSGTPIPSRISWR